MYRAVTARERERWHGFWLLAQGWTALVVSEALEREPHTIGTLVAAFSDNGPTAIAFQQPGGSRALGGSQQAQLKAAIQALPEKAGGLRDGVCRTPHRSATTKRYRLCPKRREAFVTAYAALPIEARQRSATTKRYRLCPKRREAFVTAYAALPIEARQRSDTGSARKGGRPS